MKITLPLFSNLLKVSLTVTALINKAKAICLIQDGPFSFKKSNIFISFSNELVLKIRLLILKRLFPTSIPFSVSEDRQKKNSKQIYSEAGTLMLMKAARNEDEQKYRPIHYVQGPVNEDRYTVLLRTRTEKKMKKLNRYD